jgi:site-specific recombinase XerD
MQQIGSPLERPESHVAWTAPSVHGAREEWLLDQQIRNLSPVTVAWYREKTEPLLRYIEPTAPVTTLQREDVRRLLADIQARGCKPSTVHAAHRALRVFINWCVEEQGLAMDIRLVKMRPPLVPDSEHVEVFTGEELARLEDYFKPSLRDTLLQSLLLRTGIRLAELVNLKLEDRPPQTDQLHILGKGRRLRVVPMSARLMKDWLRYIDRDRGKAPGKVIALERQGVRAVFRRAAVATKVHVTPHKYRHSFATAFCRRAIEKGEQVDLERLRIVLGHRTYALLPRYIHLAKSDVVKDWDRIAPF